MICGSRCLPHVPPRVLPKFVDPPSRQARIPKTLPVYIFNGSRDPVSDNIGQLLDAYRTAGLTQVVHKTYADGRHESLNETNRDLVTRDLIAWL
jgi:alpha-beta hydrolase superfamily lysophospholipase